MKNRNFAFLVIGLSILFIVVPCQSQSQPQNINDWLNQELQAKINQRSNTKQTESPAQSNNSTSLVDQSSATDLISAALNIAGINQNTGNDTTPQSFSVTASAYSIYALVKGRDPLDATFYNANAGWRRVSFTLGQDNGSTSGTTTTPRATIAGIKWLIINRRDLSNSGQTFSKVFGDLWKASTAFGLTSTEIAIYLLQNEKVQQQFVEPEWTNFLNAELTQARSNLAQVTAQASQAASEDEKEKLKKQKEKLEADVNRIEGLQAKTTDQLFASDTKQWTREEKKYFTQFQNTHLGAGFSQLLTLIGDSGLNDLRQIINRRVDIFPSLNQEIRKAIESLRKKPQFSLSFTSTTRPENGANEYVAEAIYDYGVANRMNLTLNDNFTYKDSKTLGGITRGSKFVGDLQFQLTPEKRLSGRAPVTFDTAVEGDWMTKTSPTYKGQLKLKIPIAEGIDLPVSVTFANKTDLIKEKDVIGRFGFTFDTAKLLSLFSK